MARGPLEALRVLDLSHQIAGPYCTKLLADLGADVVKLERPGGDPLRAWGPFPVDRDAMDRDAVDREGPNASGLFRYLNANKRSVVLDLKTPDGVERALELAAGADLVVENFRPGTLERLGLGFDDLRAVNARIALVRISAFGQTGPWKDRLATDLVLQAAGGWVAAYNAPGAPVRVGGRLPEYVSGAFAAASALTAVAASRRRGEATLVDLSMQETQVGTLPYPQVTLEALRALPPSASSAAPARFSAFGIQACKDGFVGINILTDAHWADACHVIGAPEFAESRGEVARNQVEFEAFARKLGMFLDGHSAEEILALCQAARIPTAIVASGKTLFEASQVRARSFFVEAPGGGFQQPGFPYRMSASGPSLRDPAPDLPAEGATIGWRERTAEPLGIEVGSDRGLPFAGLRVLDLGSFWAGPYMGMYLASLGADVVKVESIQRPDGFRYTAPLDVSKPDWYEAGTLFQGTNLGKRDITLDLSQPEGRELLLRLARGADLVIENYAPRVLERFGLDYEVIRSARPDVIMVRMPAFGLTGPWRDYVGWAMAIAQACGISWLTGDPSDELPRNPGAFLDPAVAMHATVAFQAALAHRRRTGEGQLIEMPQLETAACMCAEPVIDYTQSGRVQERVGNRSARYPLQGVYPSAGGAAGGGLLALSARNEAECRVLGDALGLHAVTDEALREACRTRNAAELASDLQKRGVAAAVVLGTQGMYDDPQLLARDYYQTVEHPVTGRRRYPVWPMRFSFQDGPAYRSATPTLGQHNDEVLGGELGLGKEELERLRADAVIGERWTGRP